MQDVGFIFNLAIFVVSVVIHEVSHGVVANMLGDPTARLAGRLTLNPISHIDPIGSILVPLMLSLVGGPILGWAKPVPYNPYNLRGGKWGPAIVAAAGPLSNLFMAVVFGIIIRIAASSGILTQQFFYISLEVIKINLVLAVFNLVPIPPLDGSKVLFAMLPYQYRSVQQFLESNQYIFLAIFVFFLWNFVTPLVGFLLRIIVGI